MIHPIVSHEHKFVCFWNAKCACGTVKTWFLNLHGIYEWEYSPHSEIEKHTPRIEKTELFNNPLNEYYKFIVVRNPWKRLVSYYKNKKILMRHKNLNFNIDVRENKYTGDYTFKEMLYYIKDIPDRYREDHIQSQFSQLEDLKFDKIVKLESFDVDMNNVTTVLNLPNVIDFKNFYHQPPSPISKNIDFVYDTKPLDFLHDELPSYEYFYNDELKDLVNDIYHSDIKQFNYQFED